MRSEVLLLRLWRKIISSGILTCRGGGSPRWGKQYLIIFSEKFAKLLHQICFLKAQWCWQRICQLLWPFKSRKTCYILTHFIRDPVMDFHRVALRLRMVKQAGYVGNLGSRPGMAPQRQLSSLLWSLTEIMGYDVQGLWENEYAHSDLKYIRKYILPLPSAPGVSGDKVIDLNRRLIDEIENLKEPSKS